MFEIGTPIFLASGCTISMLVCFSAVMLFEVLRLKIKIKSFPTILFGFALQDNFVVFFFNKIVSQENAVENLEVLVIIWIEWLIFVLCLYITQSVERGVHHKEVLKVIFIFASFIAINLLCDYILFNLNIKTVEFSKDTSKYVFLIQLSVTIIFYLTFELSYDDESDDIEYSSERGLLNFILRVEANIIFYMFLLTTALEIAFEVYGLPFWICKCSSVLYCFLVSVMGIIPFVFQILAWVNIQLV